MNSTPKPAVEAGKLSLHHHEDKANGHPPVDLGAVDFIAQEDDGSVTFRTSDYTLTMPMDVLDHMLLATIENWDQVTREEFEAWQEEYGEGMEVYRD